MNNLLDRLLEKTAIITDNISHHDYGPPGSTFVIKHISAQGTVRGIPTGGALMGNNISLREIDIDPKQFLGISTENFSIVPSKKIEYDQFQNIGALEIKNESTIYLSASLRARLDVNPGDKIVIATEKDKKGKLKYFIAKDLKEGTELKEDFTIDSHSYVKALGTYISQSILFISPIPVYNENHPDFTFYTIGQRAYEPLKVMEEFQHLEFDPLVPGYLKKKTTTSVQKELEKKGTVGLKSNITITKGLTGSKTKEPVTIKWGDLQNNFPEEDFKELSEYSLKIKQTDDQQ